MAINRGAQIPDASSPGQLHFVRWPNNIGPSAQNLLHDTLLVLRILTRLLQETLQDPASEFSYSTGDIKHIPARRYQTAI